MGVPAPETVASGGLGAGDNETARFLAENPQIESVEFMLPDTNGVIRGKWGPPASLKKIFSDGMQLPYSIFGLDVWGREVHETGLHIVTGDKDGFCRVVPGSLKEVTWAKRPTGQVLVSMHHGDGTPFYADPRHVLARVLQRYAARGLKPVVAFELEFYLLKPDVNLAPDAAPPEPDEPERQQMYSLHELELFEDVFADIRTAAEVQDLPLDTTISEAGPGQFEINLYHKADAMAAADDAILLRRLIIGVARRHGLRATFMAKPFTEWPGNGMHVHASVIDQAGRNIFSGGREGDARHRAAIAGLLATMPETLPLYINTFNGFRRLAPESYAPTRAIWGYDNRSVAVRVPAGGDAARRVEHRIAGADAHPHLVLAGILAGMLEGIEKGFEPPPPVEGNAYEGFDSTLNNYMGDALDHFVRSAFIAEWLGEEFRHIFNAIKRAELRVFEDRITRLEYDTYL